MKARYGLGLALLAGVAIGAGLVGSLHAQGKHAYVVIGIRSINDADSFKTALQKVPAVIASAGGHYVVRTDKIISLDGKPPQRFALIGFDSVEKAQAWYNSPEQKELTAVRIKATDSLAFIVEGAD